VENFALSERPWIEVGTQVTIENPNYIGVEPLVRAVPDIPIFPNFPFNLSVATKNYGKSPALRAYTDFEVDWIDVPTPLEPNLRNVPIPTHKGCQPDSPFSDQFNQAEFPNGTYFSRSNRMIPGSPTTDKWVHLRNALFVYGCVRYKDSSNLNTGEFYQTDFCRYLYLGDTPHQWIPCWAGNGVR
jgi:hypothetical protein